MGYEAGVIRKARKKPVVIEAMYFDGFAESGFAITHWVNANGGEARYVSNGQWPGRIEIVTLEGTHDVATDYWIIKGVKDEFYGCEGEIFEETYDVLPETPCEITLGEN